MRHVFPFADRSVERSYHTGRFHYFFGFPTSLANRFIVPTQRPVLSDRLARMAGDR